LLELRESRCGEGEDLFEKAFVRFFITFAADTLLQECEKDRDDDACFETFSETDEEDYSELDIPSHYWMRPLAKWLHTGNSKDVDCHDDISSLATDQAIRQEFDSKEKSNS
jgi:hypothetical protein